MRKIFLTTASAILSIGILVACGDDGLDEPTLGEDQEFEQEIEFDGSEGTEEFETDVETEVEDTGEPDAETDSTEEFNSEVDTETEDTEEDGL